MATTEQLEEAEKVAGRKAMSVYMETLKEELEKLGCANVLEEYAKTTHMHYALVVGTVPGIIKHTIEFHLKPSSVETVLRMARERGDL